MAGFMEASEEIPVLEVPTGGVDRSMGDVHPFGNPHYWLNPNNGLIIADHIAKKMGKLDPMHASQYQENAHRFEEALRSKISAWNKEIISLRGQSIVTYHKSFSYFMDWAGIKSAGFLESKPGIPPNPSHLMELIDITKNQKIPLIVAENYYDPKPGKELSEKTGANYLILATSVAGDKGIQNYFDLFDYLISKFKEGLQ